MSNIRRWRLVGSAGAALLMIALVGCNGQNTASKDATGTTSKGDVTQVGSNTGENAPAELASFFPGAMLMRKSLPTIDEKVGRMGDDAGTPFTGDESEWEVYEATKDGKRIGMAMRTRTKLAGGEMMRVDFAVDPEMKLMNGNVFEGPDKERGSMFVHQMMGRGHANAFKVGQDLQSPAGMPEATAQSAADSVHKGLIMLETNFPSMQGEKRDGGMADMPMPMDGNKSSGKAGAGMGADPDMPEDDKMQQPTGMTDMSPDESSMMSGMMQMMPEMEKETMMSMSMAEKQLMMKMMMDEKPMADDMDKPMAGQQPDGKMGMPMDDKMQQPNGMAEMSAAEKSMMTEMMGMMSPMDKKTMIGMSMAQQHLMMKMVMAKKPMGSQKPGGTMTMPPNVKKPMGKGMGGMSPQENSMMMQMMGKMSAMDKKTMKGMSMAEKHLVLKMTMDKKPMGKKPMGMKPMGGM